MQSKVAIVLLLAAASSARQFSTPLLKRQSSCPTECTTICCEADEDCQTGDNGQEGCCPSGETCTGDAPPPFESIPSLSFSVPDFSDYTSYSYNSDDYTSYLPSDFPTDFSLPADYTSYLPSDFTLPADITQYLGTDFSLPTNIPTQGGGSGGSAPSQGSGGSGGGLGIQSGPPAGAGNAVRPPLAQPIALLGAAALGGLIL